MEFDPARGVSLRNTMLSYLYPMIAPHVVPFGYDEAGGGAYYGFDTTGEPVAGEFPVVYVPYGGAMWERLVLADSFPEFCRGTEQLDREVYWDCYGRRRGAGRAETGIAPDPAVHDELETK